jgi:hypothetical protein
VRTDLDQLGIDPELGQQCRKAALKSGKRGHCCFRWLWRGRQRTEMAVHKMLEP